MKSNESPIALDITRGICLTATLIYLGATGYALGQGIAQSQGVTDKMLIYALVAAVCGAFSQFSRKAKFPKTQDR